ncbi:Six-hairpin glycosidase-like protein [Diplogelasinospora grovesii]|uniref:Six-hairpin glycosidase-like protein n=1 Tax=Diplogelasinospora grovesii TaxID=303347 RepID=A0AAN6S8I6_9PEZI|nr:Six-hairpin glycosidase-like protein [Diplogelasinospora grovesii]
MAGIPFLSGEAHWIWAPDFDDAAAVGQFVLFRKTFSLEAVPSEATSLHVSADTRYQLYINGQSASFGPCKSYATRWNYETIDITPYLRPGSNVVAARVLRFSSSHPGCLSMIRTPLPGLILHCKVSGDAIHTDTTWKVQKDHATEIVDDSEWDFRLGPPFLSLSERVDGRLSSPGWLTSAFDDSKWPTAVIKTIRRKMSPMLDPRRLVPREIPTLTEEFTRFDGVVTSSGPIPQEAWVRLIRDGAAVKLPPGSVHSVDIESKLLTTGFVDFTCSYDGPEVGSPSVEFLFAECYEPRMEEGKPRAKGDRANFRDGQLSGHKDTYIPHGGLNRYSPFWWRTFRYVRLTITIRSSPLVVNALTYRSTHYPLHIGTSIQTSSVHLKRLWDISVNTLRNCMHETYEDCPFYEQNQFAMDSRSQILFTYLLSRDDRLARKTMQEFYASRREDGLVETHFPNPGRSLNIPTFSLFWVLMIYDHMVNFGDERLIKRYIGAVDGVLNYFDERINDLGLVGQFDPDCWAFVDWVDEWFTPGRGFTGLAVPKAYYERGAATYNSLLYAYTLLKASEICAFLGRTNTAEEYLSRQQRLIQAVQRHCYDSGTGFFLDGPGASGQVSQHTQIFAVLSGCAAGADAKNLIRQTILHGEEHKLAKASFAMGFYVFRAASEVGVYEECWDTLMHPWEKMMRQNLTTWAESESMMRSDCHGWSATPLYEIGREILGLQCHSQAYLDRVLGRKDETQITLTPRRELAPDISANFLVGGNRGDVLSVAWNPGEKLRLESTKDMRVRILHKDGWETRGLTAESKGTEPF